MITDDDEKVIGDARKEIIRKFLRDNSIKQMSKHITNSILQALDTYDTGK